jgi:uncharacterized protein (DUF488 family)
MHALRRSDAGTVWTIGHSTHPIDAFLGLLARHRVRALVDVRRHAGSRKHPQFNPDALGAALSAAGIAYVAIPALGGRRATRPDSPHVAWRNASFRGYADYMDTPAFATALDALAAQARAARTAFMCAEGLWWQCHRALIADRLKADGWEVLHIDPRGEVAEHPFTSAARVVDGRLDYGGQSHLPGLTGRGGGG